MLPYLLIYNKFCDRFLHFESLTSLEAKSYVKAPRLGRPMTPFLTGIPTPTSGEPTKKKARTGERVVDDFASDEGKKFITKQDPHKTGSQFLRYKQWPRKEINKSWATFKPELACFQFFFSLTGTGTHYLKKCIWFPVILH